MSDARITRGHSCTECQLRKVRCNGERPCSTCARQGRDCVDPPPKATGRPKRKANVLGTLDHSGDGGRTFSVPSGLDLHRDRGDIGAPSSSSEPAAGQREGMVIVDRGDRRYLENTTWTGLRNELQLASNQSRSLNPLNATPPTLENHPKIIKLDRLIFGCTATGRNLADHHPEPVQIARLWQVFLDNVYPLLKLFHGPTMQREFFDASCSIPTLQPRKHALMFAIYLCAINSMTDYDCSICLSGESRDGLLAKYAELTQEALAGAEFTRATTLDVLIALTLFLLSMRNHCDNQALWLLTGMATRMAQRIGLHRESALKDLPPFEREIRRRLWWQIIILDTHTAQLAGTSTSNAFSSWDTKSPLNVDDSELDPAMTVAPVERVGLTDMVFCIVRFKIGEFMRRTNIFGDWARADRNVSGVDMEKAVTEFKNELVRKYLTNSRGDYMDLSVPIHALTSSLINSAIHHMRLSARHPRHWNNGAASASASDVEVLFIASRAIVAGDNKAHSEPKLKGYAWHVSVYFPFEAFIILLTTLTVRTGGPSTNDTVDYEVREAWAVVHHAFENHPRFITQPDNALYWAMGNLTLKAWDNRVAVAGHPNDMEKPSCIKLLREQRQQYSRPPTPEGYWTSGPTEIRPPSHSAQFDGDGSHVNWSFWQNLLDDVAYYGVTGHDPAALMATGVSYQPDNGGLQ